MTVSDVLAVPAFGLSLVLAGIRIWEALVVRPKIIAKIDWLQTKEEPVLRIVVANIGRRKDTVAEIRFKERGMARGRGWTPFEEVFRHLPVVLDVNESSSALYVPVDHRAGDAFAMRLRSDQLHVLEVQMIGGGCYEFDVPSLLVTKRKWETREDLPVATVETWRG